MLVTHYQALCKSKCMYFNSHISFAIYVHMLCDWLWGIVCAFGNQGKSQGPWYNNITIMTRGACTWASHSDKYIGMPSNLASKWKRSIIGKGASFVGVLVKRTFRGWILSHDTPAWLLWDNACRYICGERLTAYAGHSQVRAHGHRITRLWRLWSPLWQCWHCAMSSHWLQCTVYTFWTSNVCLERFIFLLFCIIKHASLLAQ